MNNALAELKDIHVPHSVELWPPAYGWWLLAALIFITVIGLIIYIIKRRRVAKAKRQAIAALKILTSDTPNWPVAMNSILKRVVQSYLPNLAVQQLYGQRWASFLTRCLAPKRQTEFENAMLKFQQALYQPEAFSQEQFDSYQTLLVNWLKQAKLTSHQAQEQLSRWFDTPQEIEQGESHV